jgi:hypothetical protein
MGIQIQSKEDGENLISYLQTKEFKMMLSGCMFSSFRIDWNLFKEFRDGFWRPIPLAPAPAPGPSVRIKRPQLAKYNK